MSTADILKFGPTDSSGLVRATQVKDPPGFNRARLTRELTEIYTETPADDLRRAVCGFASEVGMNQSIFSMGVEQEVPDAFSDNGTDTDKKVPAVLDYIVKMRTADSATDSAAKTALDSTDRTFIHSGSGTVVAPESIAQSTALLEEKYRMSWQDAVTIAEAFVQSPEAADLKLKELMEREDNPIGPRVKPEQRKEFAKYAIMQVLVSAEEQSKRCFNQSLGLEELARVLCFALLDRAKTKDPANFQYQISSYIKQAKEVRTEDPGGATEDSIFADSAAGKDSQLGVPETNLDTMTAAEAEVQGPHIYDQVATSQLARIRENREALAHGKGLLGGLSLAGVVGLMFAVPALWRNSSDKVVTASRSNDNQLSAQVASIGEALAEVREAVTQPKAATMDAEWKKSIEGLTQQLALVQESVNSREDSKAELALRETVDALKQQIVTLADKVNQPESKSGVDPVLKRVETIGDILAKMQDQLSGVTSSVKDDPKLAREVAILSDTVNKLLKGQPESKHERIVFELGALSNLADGLDLASMSFEDAAKVIAKHIDAEYTDGKDQDRIAANRHKFLALTALAFNKVGIKQLTISTIDAQQMPLDQTGKSKVGAYVYSEQGIENFVIAEALLEGPVAKAGKAIAIFPNEVVPSMKNLIEGQKRLLNNYLRQIQSFLKQDSRPKGPIA